jgi:long-chain acyl-CoA synthetase
MENSVTAIKRNKITVIPGVPNLYYGIVEYSKRNSCKKLKNSLKICISGSTPLNSGVKENFELLTGCKIIEGYGLSEAPTATHCNPMQGINKIGSIGLPLPDVECRLIPLKGNGNNENIEGELVIRSPQVMKGYYRSALENRSVLRKGWLFTGDVARMDNDGYFFLIDRKKDVIKASGFQVWPKEIEEVLIKHPKVKEVAVAGVKDRRQGEKVIAWIVPVNEQKVTQKGLKEWCDSFLARYKIPSEFVVLNKLPRSAVGKVLRHELVRHYTQK